MISQKFNIEFGLRFGARQCSSITYKEKRMKKSIAGIMVAAMVLTTAVPYAQEAEKTGGGVEGFLAGCCFGVRGAADYNGEGIGDREFVPWFLTGCCLGGRTQIDYVEGQSIHWRDWAPLIPYAGVVFHVWDGIDGYNGVTRTDIAEAYGSTYF
jgi:hypothetical protein